MAERDAQNRARIQRQKKVFTNWVNFKLANRDDNIMVTDIMEDLKDGFVMYALLEELSGQSLKSLGKMTRGKLRIQHVANMNIVFKYLVQTVKMVGVGPQDIVDGNETLVLGMLWSIIVFFMAKDLGGVDDMQALKKKIIRWAKKHTAPYDDVEIDNLTSDWQSGKPFLAILNNVNPSNCPYDPSEDPTDNIKRAFKDMADKYGIPMLIDPEDPDFWKDEKAMIPQLMVMMKMLPDDVADKDTIADQASDKWLNDEMPKVLKDLDDLCAIPSIAKNPDHVKDVDAAAEKVKQLLNDAGADNVIVDEGTGGGAPFVVGDIGHDENKPTVLIYANYTVSDPDDPAGGTWAGEPFVPITDDDGNFTAKGASEDKAHVVTPIAAVKSILDTHGADALPVNLKVVVGGVPPPTSKHYDPSDNTQKLKDFINKNKDTLMPDYILVSEPDGSLLAPNAAAGMFCCRGFVSFDVTASSVNPTTTEEPFCARWVGACLDPAMGLAKAVSTLRGKDGQIAVQGLTSPINQEFRDAVKGVEYGEKELRADSGYLASVKITPEKGSSLTEQLCFSPGVSVVSLGGDFGGAGPEATIPRVARIRVHANLPPRTPVAVAYDKLTSHIEAAVPFGLKVDFSNMLGEPGWVSDPTHQFFKSTCEAMGKAQAPRSAVSCGNPEYKPIPATFANCFGKPTYMHGVNDADRHIGHANESIKVEDVKKEVKGFIKTLMGLTGLPLGESASTDGAIAITVPVSSATGNENVSDSPPPAAASSAAPAASPKADDGPVNDDEKLPSPAPVTPKETSVEDAPSPPMAVTTQASPPTEEIGAILAELNAVRLDPSGYAAKLEALQDCYNDENVFIPKGDGAASATHEGWSGVASCIEELRQTKPMCPLVRKDGMESAAADHAAYLCSGPGRMGHVGPNNDRAADRITKYGIWFDIAGEVIAYREKTPEGIVRQILVCDGEPKRSDRAVLLNPNMKVCGISNQTHPSLDYVVVVSLSAGFGMFPLKEEQTVECTGQADAGFVRVLESIPSLAAHNEIYSALEDGKTVIVEYKVTSAIFTLKNPDGTQEKKGIDWSTAS